MLDGILGRQDHKRIIKGKTLITDGYLALLHGLEQSALDFGRGPVDFISQNDIGKYRSFAGGEISCFGIVDQGADKITGKQVGRELDPLE